MISSRLNPNVPDDPPPRNLRRKGSGSSSFSTLDRASRARSRKDSRTISQRFIRAPQFDISQFVWIEEDEKVWILCTILNQDNTVLKLQDVESAAIYTIDIGFDELKLCNGGLVANMTKLQHIHEPAILYNLSRRFLQRHEFYTYAGRNALVSVNPCSWEYPMSSMKDYFTLDDFSETPHPYVLAEQAFRGICASTRSHPRHQSIVISGDSGAGKTETSKLLLNYLTKRTDSLSQRGSGSSISQEILQASPILEAFGNAKTVHNPNSSRFGRYVKILFCQNEHSISDTPRASMDSTCGSSPMKALDIVGAMHEIYLLEKNRVLGQANGEQNFHIFYQYLSGIGNGSLELVGFQDLTDLYSFRLLNPCDSLDVMYDKFLDTQKSLSTITSPETVAEIWNLVGGILQLGNVDFVDNETPEGNAAYISGLSTLQSACMLLDVNWKEMRELMTQKVIETRDERFVVPLTYEGAIATRDAVCKSLYGALFQDIVSKVNSSLCGNGPIEDQPFIGVLDLFGFETMSVNGFDQFMINYANEAMQNCFNKCILQTELKLFEEENIQCSLSMSDCPNNQSCLELIASGVPKSKIPSSILLILDSVCQHSSGGDAKFCESLHKTLGNDSEIAKKSEQMCHHFPYTHPKDQRHLFKVKHYAGVVTYSVNNAEGRRDAEDDPRPGWVESNKDAVPIALDAIMTSSGNSWLKNFKCCADKSIAVAANANNLSRQKYRMKSVATSFSTSIRELCTMLESTDCAFVQCIKPNPNMSPEVVDNACVINQIRSLSLLQTLQVSQVGLLKHLSLSFSAILGYISSTLCTKAEYEHLLEYTSSMLVASWLSACGLPKTLFNMGKTKVFFNESFYEHIGENHSKIWETEEDMIASISKLSQNGRVIERLNELLLAHKRRQQHHKQFKSRTNDLQSQLSDIRDNLHSNDSKTNAPTLLPFKELFDSIDVVNSRLEAAHLEIDFVNDRICALEVAMEQSVAPVNEIETIKRDITEKMNSARSMLSVLPQQVTTVNAYESEIRSSILEAQEEANDISMAYWDNILLADKSLDSVSNLLSQLEECGDESCGDQADAITKQVEGELNELSSLFLEKLPSSGGNREDRSPEKWQNLWKCDEAMILLANEVISKGAEILALCDAVTQLCVEAEAELVESKKTMSHFKKATRSILCRFSNDDELNGDGHGMLHSVSESTVDNDESLLSKSRSLSASHSVSFCDEEGELDDDNSAGSRRNSRRSLIVSRGKRLTAKSLRLIQREVSVSSGKPGDVSTLQSFSFETDDFDDREDDDDEALSVIDMDFWIIPNGWEEYFDPDSQNTYYLNTITQTTQWERPEEPAVGTAGSVTWADDTNIDPNAKENGESSRKTTPDSKSVNATGIERKSSAPKKFGNELSPIAENKCGYSCEGVKFFGKAESVHSSESTEGVSETPHIEEIQSAASKCNLNYGRVTTTQLDTLSTLPKEGHLMKQSNSFFMSRWTKKFFVLNRLRFECYEKSEHYYYGLRKPVVMTLTLSTCTSFTDDANTFIVQTTDDSKHTVTWTLAAPNHSEKNEWVTYINAHVYTHHCNKVFQLGTETALDRRLMTASRKSPKSPSRGRAFSDEDVGSVAFWQLTHPETQGKGLKRTPQMLPVGIRTLPNVNSSRTGEGVFPGEHVEVVATIEENNQTFLELADNRGWVFAVNPKTGAPLFVPAVGYTYRVQRGLKFQVASTETDGVPIQYNPGDCSPFTGAQLQVDETVETTASFVLDVDLKHSLFVKLADGRGWVDTRGRNGGIGLRALK